MKRDRHQRSKQGCQDLWWKVHDCAQSFVLCSYITGMFLLVSCSVRSKQLIVLSVRSRPKKQRKA